MLTALPAGKAYWLDICRSYSDRDWLTKSASLGGDGQDTSFEQAFSNLAHAYLRDKAPTLLDHELGFQLIDRNQENTKAIGVFAFKVGSQRLFAPVFFLRGELKGHELLYLRNQDAFVPLKENRINDILNRKPNILGNGVARQTSQLGVRFPDLNRISQSPSKMASDRFSQSVQPFLPVMAHLATQDMQESISEFQKHCSERLNLAHFMKQASLPALEAVVDLMHRKPAIGEAFDRWYGMSVISDAIKEASARLSMHSITDNPYVAVNRNQPIWGSLLSHLEKTAADDDNGPDYQQKLEIITPESTRVQGSIIALTEDDQEKLLNDNVLIKDHRKGDEVSVPVNLQVEEKLSNPTDTGIYQMLCKSNDFEKCLVVTNPHGPNGRKNVSTVVRLDDSQRNWANFTPQGIFTLGQDESLLGGEESWREWFDSLPDITTISDTSNGVYMAVGPRRNATLPFTVRRKIGTNGDTKTYEVRFFSDTTDSQPFGVSRSMDSYSNYDSWRDGERLHLDAKIGTQIRSAAGDVYLPVGYKLLKLTATKKVSDGDDDGPDMECSCSETLPITPGNLLDARRMLLEKTAALKVTHDGVRYHINERDNLTPVNSLIHLVRDHGLTEADSRFILKEAAAQSHKGSSFSCRVKYANPFLSQGGPTAPGFNDDAAMNGFNPMGFAGQSQQGYEQDLPVPDMSGRNTDPNIYNVNPANMPEPMDANGVNRAIQSGQREVFDVSMIGSMLRAVRDDTMIDRYLPDLLKAVDRLGRILFQFYWHQDKFAERYGKQDMPELEDSLRNAFEMLDDVELFLQQKTIQPYPEEDVRDIDLANSDDHN